MKINMIHLVRQTVSLIGMVALALFLPAGTLAWPIGWVFLMMVASSLIFFNLWLLKNNPELLQERLSFTRSDQKGWDKLLFPLVLAFPIASLVFVSFDAARAHWSPVSQWAQGLGCLALLLSFIIFLRTYQANTFLSTVVRIQKDRGHKVASTGPYRYVRHPMYLAFILVVIGTPLLLGAWSGILLALIFIIFVGRRAVMEERTLAQELDGYAGYMKQVKYRFFPLIW